LVAAELGLGFPVRREEIWRFGGRSRRVVRVANKQVDDRSFAEVAAMDTTRGFGQGNLGGNSSRPGDRVGPGRFNEERSFERGEGNYRSRERGNQEIERDSYRGSFGGGLSNFQGGYREERQWFEQPRTINNKRPFDEREKREWEEQELREKLRREQEEIRFKDQGNSCYSKRRTMEGKRCTNSRGALF
jgi:hypothetical protein